MKLQLEDWLSSQTLSSEAQSCFEESFMCYKVGAYKAALLFGYLGFLTTVRDRILQSQPPQGIPPTLWTKIQSEVSNHALWDGVTFDTTQQKKPAPVFAIDEELRDQVKYWKDRRNDCAHSKQNQIVAAHCESFYAFVRSTLNRFFVGSSLESLKGKFSDFFDPTLTPAGAPIQDLVQDVGAFLSGHDLDRFVCDAFETANKQGRPRIYLGNTLSKPARSLLGGLIKYGSTAVKESTANFIMEDRERCYRFISSDLEFVHIAGGNPTLVRWLWNRAGENGEADYALLSCLLRNRLIPTLEIREALRTFITKAPSGLPSEDDRAELRNHGFYNELKDLAVATDIMTDFEKANRCKELLVDLLDWVEIDYPLAKAIFRRFNVSYHPWHLRDALNEFFEARSDKRNEYRRAISEDSELGIPKHLEILATE
jgi:hypothetical protein